MADYLKIPEVARRLDVSEPTVRRMVKGGKLPSVFIGGAYRVSEEDLGKYLEAAKVQPGDGSGKVQSPPPEAGQERRESVRDPWRAFVDRYLSRWEKAAETGAFDRGAAMEFEATLEDLSEALSEISEEVLPTPMVFRLMHTLQAVSAAYEAKLEGSQLRQAREKRERVEAAFRSVSGEEDVQASG